ncbi:hypothetical protein CERSUDRAFT_53215 [Gelatoporia subvermispora B]|uniref:Hydrophobin n=1 Tax=Ceriporiopsis subvermispora (strain B) TaxID=914234 RepID=M2RBR1_CERS8|nr:hypothetical protein CERSUDRAFT_53215 [Gelatoporia subvermispora B]
MPGGSTGDAGTCNTGPVQCCKSVQPANSEAASGLLNSVGVVLQDLSTPIGITCSPIAAIGDGSSCSEKPVCCENNTFNGLIAIGCVNLPL